MRSGGEANKKTEQRGGEGVRWDGDIQIQKGPQRGRERALTKKGGESTIRSPEEKGIGKGAVGFNKKNNPSQRERYGFCE